MIDSYLQSKLLGSWFFKRLLRRPSGDKNVPISAAAPFLGLFPRGLAGLLVRSFAGVLERLAGASAGFSAEAGVASAAVAAFLGVRFVGVLLRPLLGASLGCSPAASASACFLGVRFFGVGSTGWRH